MPDFEIAMKVPEAVARDLRHAVKTMLGADADKF
jgi:hypothetical protein